MKKRYPEDIVLSADEKTFAKIREVFSNYYEEDYWSLQTILTEKANEASDTSDFEFAKVLWLISDIASLLIKPESINAPFGPFIVTTNGRSAVAEDFKQEDIQFLVNNIDCISVLKIRARVYDLAWLLIKPRNIQYALSAIDNYLPSIITVKGWVRDTGKCIERAIRLCLLIGKPAKEKLDSIEILLVSKVLESTISDGFLPFWIIDLVQNYGLARKSYEKIIDKCVLLGDQFSINGDRYRAKEYFILAAKCQKTLKQFDCSNALIIRCIEELEKEESELDLNTNQLEMKRVWIYENVIKLIRSIPREIRMSLGLDVKLDAYIRRMNESNETIVRNMVAIEMPPIHIGDIVSNSKMTVQGKSTIDALKAFLNIVSGVDELALRNEVENNLKQPSLVNSFQKVHYSHDGRIVRRVSGMKFNGIIDQELIWAEMIKDYQLKIGFYVQAIIWPALEVMQMEHRLTLSDFISICNFSPIVPPGREDLVGRALYFGFDFDFILAIHLLAPQVENIVRYHLKMNGVKTTSFDSSNNQTENGLSTLIDLPEVKKIFGNDISFELKALFCDSLGPNIRNEVSHGLLNSSGFTTANTIYAWWFISRMIVNPYFQAINNIQSDC